MRIRTRDHTRRRPERECWPQMTFTRNGLARRDNGPCFQSPGHPGDAPTVLVDGGGGGCNNDEEQDESMYGFAVVYKALAGTGFLDYDRLRGRQPSALRTGPLDPA